MTLPPPECRVYTPPLLAKAMVQAIESGPDDLWLDPCIGPGAFLIPLRLKGVRKERIVGIDIDPHSGSEDASATTIRGVDFFKWCASTEHRFNRIIANPPYVAIRRLHPELQRTLISFGGGTDASFALRSNYWCAFLAASLRVLAHDGNLAFVLPAAWDYATYATELRQTVSQRFQSVEIHRCMEPLFPNVREGCVVLVAKGYQNRPRTSVRIDHDNSQALIASLVGGISHATAEQSPAPTHTSLIPFSDLYSTNIGCVTGDAQYFLLSESNRIRLELPREAVRPVLSKARHLSTAYMTLAQWNQLLKADQRVWLFCPESNALRYKAVQAYIRHGEKTCNLDGYKLSRREPWYWVPDIKENAIGFLSGMTKLGPWISLRSMRHLAATNTLYTLTAKSKMPPEERAAWALSLLSSPARQQFQSIARRYPDGLAKLEPHDVNSLRLPPPLRVKGAIEEYQRAVAHLVMGETSFAVAIADKLTRKPCF
jgi:adenine-specific DNA-methyltransferase